MICVCYTDANTGKVTKVPKELINESSDFSDKWVQLINPDEREIEFIASKTGIYSASDELICVDGKTYGAASYRRLQGEKRLSFRP